MEPVLDRRRDTEAVTWRRDEFHEIAEAVGYEFGKAINKHPPFNSAHEGFAVILEEVDELKAEVWKKGKDWPKIREEAIQIAAMALRFIYDLEEKYK